MYQTTTDYLSIASKVIKEQFPEFADLDIRSVKIQGHDNRTFRLGPSMSIRMPTKESYALKVPKEQEILPKLKSHLTTAIPTPIKMGNSSSYYPFNFSIYKWLDGESANSLKINDESLESIALELAQFLKELHDIDSSDGPSPGLHNWYRGEHISVYDHQTRAQIAELKDIIDSDKALTLWQNAMRTKWQKPPVWIHGDFASGNILIKDGRLVGVIDFGGVGIGDPACDLVIVWTFLKGKAREIFKQKLDLDSDTWLRAKAWALWKATHELCQIKNMNDSSVLVHQHVISDVLEE